MTVRATEQSWMLDMGLAQGGIDALHPESKPLFEVLGYDPTDFDRVFALVKAGGMMPKAWATVAAQVEERAEHHDKGGFAQTAADLFQRAAVLWGRAQYSIRSTQDPRKTAFTARMNSCVARVGELRANQVRRVVLDFEGQEVYALLHLPAGDVRSAPAVILLPGLDMVKEDYIQPAHRYYTSRGIVALSIDGPGQGETRTNGLTITLDNYERAVSRAIDYLSDLPEVDGDRIGLFGISAGGYWGMRAAAHDTRLGATATFQTPCGDMSVFDRAQPSYKLNYMYISGYTDEELFDREIIDHMPLGDLALRITRPLLIGFGEFDEVTHLQQVLATYERITAPKEIRVYEDEFHPIGGVAAEYFRFGAEWLERALDGAFQEPGRDVRHYHHRNGDTVDGTATPTWWTSAG
ncbi:alpha/beta hydrolase family protein [Streptomyces parvus]|uniref:alpha/beta hydrolase family protein n=1 Tax=Streptomyces parvus TaxID=66428 RepID=UPI0033ECAE85